MKEIIVGIDALGFYKKQGDLIRCEHCRHNEAGRCAVMDHMNVFAMFYCGWAEELTDESERNHKPGSISGE